MNWARVLAQIVYYFSGAFDVCKLTGAEKIRVSVPTGNFGDVLAGWFAMKMGAPIEQLILATNENDILCRFFNTGEYSLGKVFHTLSPSMDIQVASNFERYLYYKLGSNPVKLRDKMAGFAKTGSLRVELDDAGPVDADFVSAKADRQQVINTISRYYQEYNYVLDPHTAVGVFAAEQAGPAGARKVGATGAKKKRLTRDVPCHRAPGQVSSCHRRGDRQQDPGQPSENRRAYENGNPLRKTAQRQGSRPRIY